jgi:hypothetical protein
LGTLADPPFPTDRCRWYRSEASFLPSAAAMSVLSSFFFFFFFFFFRSNFLCLIPAKKQDSSRLLLLLQTVMNEGINPLVTGKQQNCLPFPSKIFERHLTKWSFDTCVKMSLIK